MWRHANPWRLALHFIVLRNVIWQFTVREVQGRYRGSYLGMAWALINPLLSLGVYTFVFAVIFQARWPGQSDSRVTFALTLFSGMVAFNVFSECAVRAPALIRSNPNYVKKVVFPLEILPLSVLGAALFHSFISLALVAIGLVLSTGALHWTLLYLPLAYLPLLMLALGCSWVLASLGVFIPDIDTGIGVALQLLFFLTPIVYPLSAVPAGLQPILRLNPLSIVVDGFRRSLIWGQPPDWPWFGVVCALSVIVLVGGYVWFMKIKPAFADVI